MPLDLESLDLNEGNIEGEQRAVALESVAEQMLIDAPWRRAKMLNEVSISSHDDSANPSVVANARYLRELGASEPGRLDGPDDQFNGGAKADAKKLA